MESQHAGTLLAALVIKQLSLVSHISFRGFFFSASSASEIIAKNPSDHHPARYEGDSGSRVGLNQVPNTIIHPLSAKSCFCDQHVFSSRLLRKGTRKINASLPKHARIQTAARHVGNSREETVGFEHLFPERALLSQRQKVHKRP